MHFDNGKPKYLSSKVLVIFTVQNWVFKEIKRREFLVWAIMGYNLQCLPHWLASYNQ